MKATKGIQHDVDGEHHNPQVFDIGFTLALDSMRGVDNTRMVKGLGLALHLN